MARSSIPLDTTLTEQHALNAIARGVVGLRTTDLFVNDAKGATLALSNTNASKAVPVGVRAFSFWADVAFRWRLNTAADTVDGAYCLANDAQMVTIDDSDTAPVATLQAILASGTGTLTINWYFGT